MDQERNQESERVVQGTPERRSSHVRPPRVTRDVSPPQEEDSRKRKQSENMMSQPELKRLQTMFRLCCEADEFMSPVVEFATSFANLKCVDEPPEEVPDTSNSSLHTNKTVVRQ